MNMKKILAGLLAALMVFTMVPVVAFAATVNAPIDAADVYLVGDKTYFTTGHVAPLQEYVDPNAVAPKHTTGGAFSMSTDVCMLLSPASGQLLRWKLSDVTAMDMYALGDTGYWAAIGFFGWVIPSDTTAGPITEIGYQINNREIVWQGANTATPTYDNSGTTTVVAEDPASLAGVGANARRFTLWLETGLFDKNFNNALWIYAKDANGTIYCMNSQMGGTTAGASNSKAFIVQLSAPATGLVYDYSFVNESGETKFVTVGADGYSLINVENNNALKYYFGYDADGNKVAIKYASMKEVVYNEDAEQYEYPFEYTDADIFMSNDCYYVSVDGTTALTEGTSSVAVAAPKEVNTNEFYMNTDLYMGVNAYYTGLYHWLAPEVKTWDAFVLGAASGNAGFSILGWHGWILPNNDKGVNHGAMTKLGYQLDDQDIVWVDGSTEVDTYHRGAASHGGQAKTTVLAEDPTTAGNIDQPTEYVRRATLWIDLSSINTVNDTLHALYLYAQDAAGNIYCLNNSMKGDANDPFLIEFGVARYDYTDGTNKYSVADDGYTLVVPQSAASTGLVLGTKLDGTYVAAPAASIIEVPAPEGVEPPVDTETDTETETEPAAPAPVATFKGASVVLGQALSITYNAIVENATTTPVMKFTLGDNDMGEVVGEYNATNGRYYFKLTGVNPQCIGDNILAEVYVDGVLAGSMSDYSIKANLVNQLSKATTTAALKTLIYNTLAYGAAAQVYTGYNTDNMINAGYESNAVSYDLGDTNGTAQGFSLSNTSSTVKINAMSVNFGDVNKIMVQYSGTDTLYVDGVAVEPASYNETTKRYTYYTDGIFASELGKVFTFTLEENGAVVATLTCSVNAYAARQQGKVTSTNPTTANNAKLAVALFNYGMAAKAYVG